MNKNSVKEWLVKNNELLNCNEIEKEINIPKGTLEKSILDGAELNDTITQALVYFITTHFSEE